MPDPALDPASPATKPAWKCFEPWAMVFVGLLSSVAASGLLNPADPTQAKWLQIIGLILSVLSALGLTASRTMVKTAAINGAAIVAASRESGAPPT